MPHSKPMSRFAPPVALITALVVVAGCGPMAYKITPVPADQTLEESVVLKDKGLALSKIALIDIEGVIMDARKPHLFGEGEHPVSLLTEKLDKAASDSMVKAVILRINSPGGTVTASDLMYNEVKHFKQVTGGKRPVVAVLMDVAASGGYYIACSADEIVAHPTTVTGSIGVIMQMVNFSDTMNKIGVSADAITSGKMKDAGSPLRKMKAEEREVFKKMVDQFYDRFVDVVAAGRPKLTKARIREVADGRVYSAGQALELGFVDRIDDLRGTVGVLKKQLGLGRVQVVTYDRPLGWKPNLYAAAPGNGPQVNLINVNLPQTWPRTTPQFLYLWAPELF
ncbi:MAG TPA: signal peptide peptidase SppA [Phycisphaerae bacterium]|nr:signal peptide peptidase SppA [Phycisphaerae bacterium]HRY69716.1 signal peptide peptidase SppA [Phycisphaerae bacterium]